MNAFREKIGWKIEVDESCFWSKRKNDLQVNFKQWRGTLKQLVFWLIKRKDETSWRVEAYIEIIPYCKVRILKSIIRGKVDFDESIIHSNGWKGYDGLVDVQSEGYFRVSYGDHEFSKWKWTRIHFQIGLSQKLIHRWFRPVRIVFYWIMRNKWKEVIYFLVLF